MRYTFSDYMNEVVSSGFLIEKSSEPQPIESGKEKDATLYEIGMRLPQLLIFKAKLG